MDNSKIELWQSIADNYFKRKKFEEAAEVYEDLIAQRPKPFTQDFYTLGRARYLSRQYDKADAAFSQVISLQPQMTLGYLWKARTQATIDPGMNKGLAKPFYEELIERAASDTIKFRAELIEAYSYLANYYFIRNDLSSSRRHWEKVKELDPANKKATEALSRMHEG